MSKDITRTEILYAYGRLQEQDDLPESCNDFMLSASLEKLDGKSKHYGFYQLCPKCEGEGTIKRQEFGINCSISVTTIACPVCNGDKLLVRPEIKEQPGK